MAALPEAAPITLAHSRRLCTDSCRAYHAIWPFVRLYGSLPSVSQDHSMLLATISAAAREGARRVLVSGAADFGILSYVIEAFSLAGAVPDVTVTDLCPTPLEMNQWYAARKGLTVETTCCDFRDFDGTGYDLAVAHNFLNFFDAKGRQDVTKTWARALRPGGAAIVIATIRQGMPATVRRFGPARTEELVERVKTQRRASAHAGLIDEDTLVALVREFAVKRTSKRSWTVDELCALFRQVGLVVERADSHETEAESARHDWHGDRICLIARKPA